MGGSPENESYLNNVTQERAAADGLTEGEVGVDLKSGDSPCSGLETRGERNPQIRQTSATLASYLSATRGNAPHQHTEPSHHRTIVESASTPEQPFLSCRNHPLLSFVSAETNDHMP